MIGQLLGRYRILEKIGAGGMGVVYRARDEHLGRDVALKVLPAGALADETARKRFRKEALALSHLNHPNIATVYDLATHDGVDFLVMEFIPGTTLEGRLAQGALPEKEIARLGTQLAEGLAAAHEQGVVHRDLKPGNLLILPDGRLKILDFGLAQFLQPAGELGLTQSAVELPAGAGTLPYMAPEQLQGRQGDARSDIYAAGAVLYEMATGRRAFAETAVPRLIDAILHQDPPPPATLNRQIPPALESIILKALDKDPERRYQSARELRVDLERLATSSHAATVAAPRAASRRPVWLAAGAVAVLLAFLAVLAIVWFRTAAPQQKQAAGRGRIEALAVMPLENLSGDPGQEYFADGMTDALITDLGKVGGLRVISRTSVMPYKKTTKPLPEIARALKVDAVVAGSIQRSGDDLRVNLQLVDASTGQQVWVQKFEQKIQNLFAVQDRISAEVTAALKLKSTAAEQPRPTGNLQAYDLYLRGKFHAVRENRDDNAAAISLLEQAVVADPTFAAAYAELARAYGAKVFRFTPQDRQSQERGFVAAEKALSLNPNLAEAHLARGLILWRPPNHFPHREAIQAYRRALALNPDLDEAHHQLGRVYMHVGIFDKALSEFERAVSINPGNTLARHRIGVNYLYQGRYEEALAVIKNTPLEFSPSQVPYHIAWALMYLGRTREAFAIVEEALKKYPEDNGGSLSSVHAVLYAAAGETRKAEEKIQTALRKGQGFGHFHHTAYNIACAYALMHQRQQALKWLQAAAEDGLPCYSLFVRDPNLDRLRSDPQFIAFIEKMKQQWEAYRAL